jgi:hypothetical protein
LAAFGIISSSAKQSRVNEHHTSPQAKQLREEADFATYNLQGAAKCSKCFSFAVLLLQETKKKVGKFCHSNGKC